MSCLFNSFSYFKDIVNNDSSEKIRQNICDYLENNPILFDDIKAEDIISWESNCSLEQYIQKMRQLHTWGGANEIKSFCNIYKVNVEVINIRDIKPSIFENKPILFLHHEDNKTIKITWNGGHYEPVR
jgi:hypothetical protein